MVGVLVIVGVTVEVRVGVGVNVGVGEGVKLESTYRVVVGMIVEVSRSPVGVSEDEAELLIAVEVQVAGKTNWVTVLVGVMDVSTLITVGNMGG